MKSRIFFSLPLVGSLFFVSCFPIRHDRRLPPPPNDMTTISSEDQQRIEEQREQMKQRQEARAEQQTNQNTVTEQTDNTVIDTPTQPKTSDYPFANPVPGKEGFVFSPYNNKLVDVRDIPSGTLVQDPTYPPAEKKYFRVP